MGHTEDRLMALAQRLIAATDGGRVEWSSSDDAGTAFSTARSAGTVVINSIDGDGAFPYELTVFDSTGRRVESLSTGYSESEYGGNEPFAWNDLWRRLYEVARGNALKIDTVINALIDDLDIPF